ncbi:DNA mismatch repair endonuclease MutL [Flavobacterium sp. ASW18X]|uniref:DNA mismatch repair endonuclease MutL n=1 Tax=Flavobacterium sp. ASW18X TaxID=2572595 RepID=UPI0010ADC1F9|nr:DNA mismatch repair endonuclease MutL [Flavobacterium sp. ASW18X]TKD62472.1 DNA mismatch repair endonuclease MutL [Flavobacterium sp. ASW18X]
MADIIKLLPDHVANQIAAGEVVQRPSSVVKELLENAIDAGADTIKLIVKDGGKTLIQVVDNGSGMSETDARLAFERHATSKITSAEDLFNLHTKGFRGEALASIAAIAHVELQTRTATMDIGVLIKIEGSQIKEQEMVVTPEGTSIAIKNLFFNIPARRNFLKSNQVELRHITDEFQRVALVHPTIAFQFYNNGSEYFNLPSESFRQRIVHIFGTKMNEKLVPVAEDTAVVKLNGFICKPAFARKSRGEQFFFANGRFIKSPYLHHAVVSAFEGLLKPEVYPGYFICLDVDPKSIDINIHPTKTEVKFDDENTLYAILRSAVKHSLGQFNVAPVLDFDRDQNLDTPYAYEQKQASLPKVSVDASFNPFAEEKVSTTQKGGIKVALPKKPRTEGWQELYAFDTVENNVFSSIQVESDLTETSLFDTEGTTQDATHQTFQLQRKFIVSTVKSGLLLINQNRAHQRVLFERFLEEITIKKAVSQQLLFPEVLEYTSTEKAQIMAVEEVLHNLGFDIDYSPKNGVEVRGVPTLLPEGSVALVLEDILASTAIGQEEIGFSQAEQMAKIMSNALAVKTGQELSSEAQLGLLNDLFACKEPKLSPTNKTIYTIIGVNELENKF